MRYETAEAEYMWHKTGGKQRTKIDYNEYYEEFN